MTSVWIIGAGKFGLRAAVKLKETHRDIRLVMVDKDEIKCRKVGMTDVDVICMDGITFLSAGLAKGNHPEWIVPAIPVHVAWLWIKAQLHNAFEIIPVEVPDEIVKILPNPVKGKVGEVYASLADFMCPDDCPEPVARCTVTRKPRPYNLYERLADIRIPGFTAIVIQSRRLAPGAGGYAPQVLFDAFSAIAQTESVVLLSTACRCHGVLQTFRIVRRDI